MLLAHPLCAKHRRGGLMFCWRFIVRLYVCSDFCQTNQIISTSTGPIFTKFAVLVKLWPWMNDRSEDIFSIPQGTLPWQPISGQNRPPFRALQFACHSLGRRRRYTTRRAIATQSASKQIRRTQANQWGNTLTIINERLEGYPSGLQSRFALHLVFIVNIVHMVIRMV